MIHIRLSLSVTAIMLTITSALGATPVLSGKYLYSQISDCASTVDGTTFPSSMMSALTTFNSSTGALSYAGSIVHFAGVNSYKIDPVSGNTTFSNTKSTLTIGSEVYQVTYSAKQGNVIALSGVGTSIPQTGETCGDQVQLTKQQ